MEKDRKELLEELLQEEYNNCDKELQGSINDYKKATEDMVYWAEKKAETAMLLNRVKLDNKQHMIDKVEESTGKKMDKEQIRKLIKEIEVSGVGEIEQIAHKLLNTAVTPHLSPRGVGKVNISLDT